METSIFVKARRKALKLTQPELASKAGVGLRFVRELEQGKSTLRMDKVNQVLQLFGFELGPVERPKQQYAIQTETGHFNLTGNDTNRTHKKKSK